MSIEQAIKKAVEEGEYFRDWNINGRSIDDRGEQARIFLDPLFWQALGKAMGREHYSSVNFSGKNMWQFYWHRLINTLAEGKSAEDFFAQFE